MWFRRDLRLDDSPALAAAAAAGEGGVVPLFVVDPKVVGPVGPNRRRFLVESLRVLDHMLGGRLVVRRGDPGIVVPAVAGELGAPVVAATADFGPYGSQRDSRVAHALAGAGRVLVTSGSPYAVAPGTVRGVSGSPLRVFSAFKRAWAQVGWEEPRAVPDLRYVCAPSDGSLDDLERDLRQSVAAPGAWGLPAWWEGLPLGAAERLPPAGPAAARARLDQFVKAQLVRYAEDRDQPGREATSRLSPYLHLGAVHPRTVLQQVGTGIGADKFRSEVAWRDFYADLIWYQPASVHQPLQAFGAHLRWDDDDRARQRFRAWATGATGYPLVDAGMRQLLSEGWVHNRVRMVAASFLVKDLHIDWRLGARWFLWHLVDGDLASNQHGWQWVAGTGTDAAPFHRIFNPGAQQERFDPDAHYVRKYLGSEPALAPPPIVDHAEERREALERFDEARELKASARTRTRATPDARLW
jgi:deoxyribodipyrimidine photo-lyase